MDLETTIPAAGWSAGGDHLGISRSHPGVAQGRARGEGVVAPRMRHEAGGAWEGHRKAALAGERQALSSGDAGRAAAVL